MCARNPHCRTAVPTKGGSLTASVESIVTPGCLRCNLSLAISTEKRDIAKTVFHLKVMTTSRGIPLGFNPSLYGLPRVSSIFTRLFHTFHSHVGNHQNKYYGYLTLRKAVVVLEMVRGFQKAAGRAGDSQSGLKYSQVQIL
jgi:hypothetical protein